MVMDIKLKYAVVAVLVMTVVSVAGVFVLVMTMPNLPAGMKQDQICLQNQARDLECGFVVDLLHEYVERKAVNIYEEIDTQHQTRLQETCKQSQRECGNIKPAAKVTGKKLSGIVNRNDVDADMAPITEWQDDRYLHRISGFERHSIRYKDGRLIVPVDGTYFVHSFVELFEPCDPSTGKPNIKDPTKPIKHSIFKFIILNKEEMELVTDFQPHMVSSNKQFNYYNSFVSSLAELKAGDELFVKVSNITYLKYTRNNYFGVNFI